MLGFYILPTAKVKRRQDLGLKSHSKVWRSPGSNPRPLVYKASSLTTTLQRPLGSKMLGSQRVQVAKVYVENSSGSESVWVSNR